MEKKVKVNKVFQRIEEDHKGGVRVSVQQGGTRSGKTFNILLWLIFGFAMRGGSGVVSIVRKTFPALRGSVMRDFFEILEFFGLYDPGKHNKTEQIYTLGEVEFEFFSADQPQKIRGRKRRILFANEANELSFEDWKQLIFRTTEFAILDYNPSDPKSYIYDYVIPRNDANLLITTYLDNPFLEEAVIREIELLRETDPDAWKVYGEGQKGKSLDRVFPIVYDINEIPEGAKFVSYGLDFGFTNDPSALVALYLKGDSLFIDELIYERGLTNPDLAKMFKALAIPKTAQIRADSSEPKSLEELRRFGFNVKPSLKGPGSITAGIDALKRYRLHITGRSANLRKEFESYRYLRDPQTNEITNEISGLWNHALDALRYAAEEITKKKSGIKARTR